MTNDEIRHVISLAECYLAGGDSPPLRADTTPTLAHAVLRFHAEIERMRPVFEAAKAWRIGRDRNIIGTAPSGGQRSATGVALIDAVDVAACSYPLVELTR